MTWNKFLLDCHSIRIETKLQNLRCFGVSGLKPPFERRVQRRVRKQWMAANHFRVRYVPVRRDHHLYLGDSLQAQLPRHLRVIGLRIRQHFAIFVGAHARRYIHQTHQQHHRLNYSYPRT